MLWGVLAVLPLFPFLTRGYVAPVHKEDVFADTACPAILMFTNAPFVSGTTVELPCLCKPQEVKTVVWFYRAHTSSAEQTQALTDDHGLKVTDPGSVPHRAGLGSRFSIRMFSLIVFHSSPADSGIYICGSERRDFFYAYDLDIQEAQKITFADRKRKHQRSSKPGSLYRTFTSFGAWSVCDRCGPSGEQVRVGLCYVDSPYLHVRYRQLNQSVTSCGSGAVLRVFGPISGEGAVLEVRRCEEACPTISPTPSKLALLMDFFGFGSASKPVGVKVYFVNHQADSVLIMGCPRAKPNMAVAWDREDTPILREHHTAQPESEAPRITIDTGHYLVFSPAQTQDSGVYYCWLEGQRVAQIRLLVYSQVGQSQLAVSHPDFYPALKMVLWAYAGMTAVFLPLLVIKAAIQTIRDMTQTHQD